jgi:hypothetical protein
MADFNTKEEFLSLSAATLFNRKSSPLIHIIIRGQVPQTERSQGYMLHIGWFSTARATAREYCSIPYLKELTGRLDVRIDFVFCSRNCESENTDLFIKQAGL